MNRAAMASRIFLAITLLPAIGAARYAAYQYRHQSTASTRIFNAGASAANPSTITKFPTGGTILGVFAPTLPRKGRTPSDVAALASFNKAVGHRATLTVAYLNWGSPFPVKYVKDAANLGARTVLELEPRGKGVPSLARIAGGHGDKWLDGFAAAIASTKVPFALSFGPEMNGSWYAYGSSTANDYIRAFRHVHDRLLKDVGQKLTPAAASRLITFMWQPSAIHTSTPSPMPYWPGSHYVEMVGLDGYYYRSTDTFRIIFRHTIDLIRQKSPNTKIMIGETAVGPMTGHQPQGIKDLFTGIKSRHLSGLIWFNRNQMSIPFPADKRIYHQDWRLQDHPNALQAFIAGLKADGPLAS
jgi:glycosyl hydrolase family 26